MDKTFKPNEEWMRVKYDEMNETLFRGALGDCNFAIFTTGKGSEGGVLGWFKIEGRNIFIERSTRRIYKDNWDRTYINRSNFVELCQPKIEINGNYSGTEHGFLATLVHEMCHYYTYMLGYAPKQSHGPEFREIGMIVSSRSNGLFTIQRIASAEQMSELELNAEMKAKREKRAVNKKASVSAIIAFSTNGQVKLTITSNQSLMKTIEKCEKERGSDVIVTNDADIIDYLFNKGYRSNMRSWRYWSLEDKPWIDEFKGMLSNEGSEPKQVQQVQQEPQKQPRRVFSIKTSSGVFEHDGTSYYELKKAIMERFPKMSEETVEKIIQNPNNYRMEENRVNVKAIVESVINEFMRNEFRGANNNDDSVEITPNMNLGEYSPLEMEM